MTHRATLAAVTALCIAAAVGGYVFWAIGEVREDQAESARELALSACDAQDDIADAMVQILNVARERSKASGTLDPEARIYFEQIIALAEGARCDGDPERSDPPE